MVVTVQNAADEDLLTVKLRRELSRVVTVAHKNRVKQLRLRLLLLVTLMHGRTNVSIKI